MKTKFRGETVDCRIIFSQLLDFILKLKWKFLVDYKAFLYLKWIFIFPVCTYILHVCKHINSEYRRIE